MSQYAMGILGDDMSESRWSPYCVRAVGDNVGSIQVVVVLVVTVGDVSVGNYFPSTQQRMATLTNPHYIVGPLLSQLGCSD